MFNFDLRWASRPTQIYIYVGDDPAARNLGGHGPTLAASEHPGGPDTAAAPESSTQQGSATAAASGLNLSG